MTAALPPLRTRPEPDDYTDDEHPAVRLRLYTEDGPAGPEWWVDGISADGRRCTDACWTFDSWAEAVGALPEFVAAHVPQLGGPR
jgi:hypothetical protein